MSKRGFTTLELIIGVSIMLIIFGMAVQSMGSLRNTISITKKIDQDMDIFWIQNLMIRELRKSEKILFPNPYYKKNKTYNHLVIQKQDGDISHFFVDPKDRLIQYSHARKKFRDVLHGVSKLEIRMLPNQSLRIHLKRGKEKDPLKFDYSLLKPIQRGEQP